MMNLTEFDPKDLVGPDRFELTSQDDLFNKLVEAVNSELEDFAGYDDEIYATEEAHIEITLTVDEFEEDITLEMVKSLQALYQTIGWKTITYEHQEETDDYVESHVFKFYFCTQPGVGALTV